MEKRGNFLSVCTQQRWILKITGDSMCLTAVYFSGPSGSKRDDSVAVRQMGREGAHAETILWNRSVPLRSKLHRQTTTTRSVPGRLALRHTSSLFHGLKLSALPNVFLHVRVVLKLKATHTRLSCGGGAAPQAVVAGYVARTSLEQPTTIASRWRHHRDGHTRLLPWPWPRTHSETSRSTRRTWI